MRKSIRKGRLEKMTENIKDMEVGNEETMTGRELVKVARIKDISFQRLFVCIKLDK